MGFELPPRVQLAMLPTPVESLDRLTEEIGGPRFFVKRDDMTGSDLSGNKVRKLEFTLSEALREGADTVITCGGMQSNHCRATAVAARKLGLRAILLLRGDRPAVANGNLLLAEWVGAEIRPITREQYKGVRDLMRDAAAAVHKGGGQAYLIPEGASNGIGSFGYVRAVEEIATNSLLDGDHFDYIVHACGSGGTAAGLIAGKAISNLDAEIVSISVCDDAEYFTQKIRSILAEMAQKYGAPFDPETLPIQIVDGYKGRGYALNTPEEYAFFRRIAALEGLVLDPVYSGKAFRGMVEEARNGRFAKGSSVLFVHTGGLFGLMAKAQEAGGADFHA